MTRQPHSASTETPHSAKPEKRPWQDWRLFGLLLLASLVAYLPSLNGELLWDDAGHVTSPELQTWGGLFRIWFEPGATQQYYPLLHSMFWIQHALWGDATLGYHLVNVLWHASSAWLLVCFLRRLSVPGALLAGWLFALHPVAVESVAWISEQKNTLSTLFYLLAGVCWLRYEDERRPSRYALATLCFLAALMTKSVTATLPAALLVVAWWRKGRLTWSEEGKPLIPWLALGAFAGVATAWLEVHQIGASGGDFTLGLLERLLLAGQVVWFYFGKLLWPADLAFFYPRWTVDAGLWWQWLPLVGALAVLALGLWNRRTNRSFLAAALLYGGTLFPVLGFVNVYPFIFSYVADHFQYLATLGMFAFLAAVATIGIRKYLRQPWTGPLLACALVCVLGTLTWRQSASYRTVIGLYEKSLSASPDSWVAHLNLGTTLDDAGRSGEALPHLQRALELKPGFPLTMNSLGNVYTRVGRPREALPLLERVIALEPRFAAAHNTLGATYMALGRRQEGLAAFRRSVELDPSSVRARVNLAWGLAESGNLAKAIEEFTEAKRREPSNPEVEFRWGLALAMHGRAGEANGHLLRAVTLQPENAAIRFALGTSYVDAGRREEALEQFREVLRIDPEHVGARKALALFGGYR